MKMVVDSTIVTLVASNVDQLCDVQVMLDFAWLLPMLTIVHSSIKFDEL